MSNPPAPRRSIDAVVDPARAGSTIDDAPVFVSVTAALAAAPDDGDHVIRLAAGTFREKLVVAKSNIVLVGAGRDATVIRHDDHNGRRRTDGTVFGTAESAVLTVDAPGFRAEGLTIENDFDFPVADADPDFEPAHTSGAQAVAVRLTAAADRARFHDVNLLGHQDTLFVDGGRVLLTDSLIAGNIDFIFGAGAAVFERCEIRTRPRGLSAKLPVGHITAPSTVAGDEAGLVFRECRLTREAGVPNVSTTLGRPWHPTTTFPDGRYADPDAIGLTVLIDCWLDGHITPAGWDGMHGTGRNGARLWFPPEDARFFECRSSGPGAVPHPARRVLDDEAAARLTAERVLGEAST